MSVRPARNGLGLCANRPFEAGEAIAWIPGRVVRWQVLRRRSATFLANCIRFARETYLDPRTGPGRYLNHSCAPNAAVDKVGRRLLLRAASSIRAGDEVVIDYSTTIGDDDVWRMRCKCGARTCRRWIGRFGLLPPNLQRAYRQRGMVPAFILRTCSLGPGLDVEGIPQPNRARRD